MTTTEVDNWPADVAGVQGPELMERFLKHAERFNTKIVFDHIHTVDFSKRPFTLTGDSGTYTCDALVIATGASAKYLGLPSEDRLHGQGVSGCATCDGFFYRDDDGVRGRRRQHGGRRSAVPQQHRRARCTSSTAATSSAPRPILIDKVDAKVAAGKIELHLWNTLDEVLGDASGVTGVRIKSTQDGGTTKDIAAARAASSPSATSPTPTSSRASWR